MMMGVWLVREEESPSERTHRETLVRMHMQLSFLNKPHLPMYITIHCDCLYSGAGLYCGGSEQCRGGSWLAGGGQ